MRSTEPLTSPLATGATPAAGRRAAYRRAADVVTIDSGTVTLNSDTSIAGLVISGGTLTGSGTLTVTGPLTWSGGTMSGTGATVAAAGALLGGPKTLSQRTLTLSGGTATVDGPSSYILLSSGATLNNQVTLDCLNDGGGTTQQGFFTGAGGGTINNSGTLRKTATGNTGATNVAVPFHNTGSAQVLAGALRLSGGGNSPSGSFTATAPAHLVFGGTHQLGASSSVSGTGTVEFDAGTTTLAGSYAITGGTSASGGTGTFTGTVTNVGPLVISSGTLAFNSTGPTIATTTLQQTGGT